MQAGLCTDGKRCINHVSSVTSYLTQHSKQRDIRTQWRTSNVSWSVFWLYSRLWQQEDKLCLRKGCRQWGKILHCQKKTREFGKMLLQSFKAFVHWVLCREVLTNQRTVTFQSLGSVGLHNYWNVTEIAIWPSAISKLQKLHFWIKVKCVSKQHLNEALRYCRDCSCLQILSPDVTKIWLWQTITSHEFTFYDFIEYFYLSYTSTYELKKRHPPPCGSITFCVTGYCWWIECFLLLLHNKILSAALLSIGLSSCKNYGWCMRL